MPLDSSDQYLFNACFDDLIKALKNLQEELRGIREELQLLRKKDEGTS